MSDEQPTEPKCRQCNDTGTYVQEHDYCSETLPCPCKDALRPVALRTSMSYLTDEDVEALRAAAQRMREDKKLSTRIASRILRRIPFRDEEPKQS